MAQADDTNDHERALALYRAVYDFRWVETKTMTNNESRNFEGPEGTWKHRNELKASRQHAWQMTLTSPTLAEHGIRKLYSTGSLKTFLVQFYHCTEEELMAIEEDVNGVEGGGEDAIRRNKASNIITFRFHRWMVKRTMAKLQQIVDQKLDIEASLAEKQLRSALSVGALTDAMQYRPDIAVHARISYGLDAWDRYGLHL